MKLRELVNSVGSSFREVTNFIRYPWQNISRIAMRRAQDEYEKIEVPLGKGTPAKNVAQETRASLDSDGIRSDLRQRAYAARTATTERIVKRQYGDGEIIPILPKDREIRGGRRGRYRVESLVKDEERMRLYQGIQVVNSKPVLIKEYLLSDRVFNQKEAKDRKEKFDRLASLNIKNGGGQDFRYYSPWDAIASPPEKRCYLIFEQPISNSSSLSEYLAKNGSMTSQQVRQVLYQVLQTLWFLHSQRLRLESDEVQQGIAHGNISLDSLAIAINDRKLALDQPQFFIYLSELAVWEDLFKPPTAKVAKYSAQKDLTDLGYVGFYLLSGGTVDFDSGQPLNPKVEQHWPMMNDIALKKFIYRLLGIERPFKTAFEARQALLEPQPIASETPAYITEPEQEEEKSNKSFVGEMLLTAFVLGLIASFSGQIILQGWRSLQKVDLPILPAISSTCCLADVPDVPTESVTYTTETDGIWNYILTNISLVSYGKTLEAEFKTRDARLSNYTLNSTEIAIEKVRAGSADFALTTYIDNLPDDLQQDEVAYDGIVVFVAFSDNKRQQSIPSALNGKITLEQLRELYTNQTIKNWSPPRGLNPKIKLYMPTENPKTIQVFEQLVFNGSPTDGFKELQQQIIDTQRINFTTKNNETYILGEVLKDFETNQTTGIGFGLLSRIFNQCAVYPLAVGEKNQEVQPLVQQIDDQVKPIDPKTDLCDDKGSYWPDVEAFKSGRYPLRYRLVVVYPKDEKRGQTGQKFAQLLKTDEGQRLLREAGLVPIRTISNNN